jgi:hypothetical protein
MAAHITTHETDQEAGRGDDPVSRAARFLAVSSRILERREFNHLFRSGPADAVLAALAPYQNPDGGFGQALEPDARAPGSQPAHTLFALTVLDATGLVSGPIVADICRYLTSVTQPDGGVPFVYPNIAEWPKAPWWEVQGDTPGSLLPTAAIVGLLRKNRVDHPWLTAATEFCWTAIEALEKSHPYEIEACVPFLDHAPDRRRAESAAERLGALVRENRWAVLDPNALDQFQPEGYAAGEVHYPHDYAQNPTSLARRWFSGDELARSLDALAAAQQDDGGWPINWQVWTPITGLEWRGHVTIRALIILRAYGRLAGQESSAVGASPVS